MPVRIGGESTGEARERERQRRGSPEPPRSPRTPRPGLLPESTRTAREPIAPRATPTPQAGPTPSPAPAAPGVPFGLRAPQVEEPKSPYTDDNIISVRGLGTPDERIRVFLPKEFEVGDQTEAFFARDEAKLPDWAQGTTTETFKVLSKERSQAEGADGWVYDMRHADIFQPVVPDDQFYGEMPTWSEWWNGLIPQSEITSEELRPFVPEKALPMVGRTEDVVDAETTLKFVFDNAKALLRHVEDISPESIEAIVNAEKAASNEARAASSSLSVEAALSKAVNAIAEEHPDDYTTLFSTPEGLSQLWEKTVGFLLSAPPPTFNLFEDPKDFILATEEAYIPEIPLLKDTIIKATETVLDPVFLFLTAVLPPAALAQKAELMGSIALGMAAGEEAAERVGLPPIVGALPGGLVGPVGVAAIRGFTRASMSAAMQAARIKPVFGEPATEILLRQGEILDAKALKQALGESGIPPGTTIREIEVTAAEARQGRHIAQALDSSGTETGRLQWREIPAQGGEPGAIHVSDVVVQTEGRGVGTGLMADLVDEATVKGVTRITGDLNSEGGIRLFGRFKAMFRDLKSKVLTQDEAITALAERRGVTGEIRIPEGPVYPVMAGGAPEGTFFHGSPTGALRISQTDVPGIYLTSSEKVAQTFANRSSKTGTGEISSWRLRPGARLIDYNSAEYQAILRGPAMSDKAIARELQKRGYEGIRIPKGTEPRRLPTALDQQELAADTLVVFDTKSLERVRGIPAMAGGAPGPTLQYMEEGVAALFDRPETFDALRKIARGMTHLPGGKRMVEIINRMAIAADPWLRSAFGWQFLKTTDDAARQITMSGFRGRRYGKMGIFSTPFRENNQAQIWVPKKAGVKEGEWISGGDVIESVMRGEGTYLSRLTETQLKWIDDIKRAVDPYVRIAERETGMHIARRQVHWPRFVVDFPGKKVTVGFGGRGKPPGLFQRVFEHQQQAIEEYGIRYKPGLLNQAESLIEGMQRITRDSILTKSLSKAKLIRQGRRPYAREEYVDKLGPGAGKGFINQEHFAEIQNIIGPGTRNPAVVVPQRINGVFRMMLTGSLDMGWGAIQLMTLMASPAGVEKWAEAMGRGFWNAIIEPKQVHRFLSKSTAAHRYALYGGNVSLETEFFEAGRMGIPLGPARNIPGVEAAASVTTLPVRAFISRLQAGFESSLLYGRIFAFDAMADVAAGAGQRVERALVRAAGGPAPLTGKAFHDEMFRLARFTDTLIGQPKLTGALTASQLQVESAYVWFATRYTRSFLGTMSYMAGRGFTPAQARVVMAKFLMGGMASTSGLIAAHGAATGKSQEEIQEDILTSIDPRQGKKFMSIKLGKDWYGLGGVYRSGFAAIAGLANKRNWDMMTWEEALWDNPIIRIWRMRATPITSTLMDFMDGEDFLGYEIDRNDFMTDINNVFGYAIDKFAPITVDSLLQDGDWSRKTPRFTAEFFGLRTSPETAWEAMEPVLNRVAEQQFGTSWEGLEYNSPAQDLVRNDPSVVAVAEGRAAPFGRRRQGEREWDRYYSGRDAIRDRFANLKADLDHMTVRGRMDGREYREQYGEAQSNEYFELTGFREGLGADFEFEDKEAPAGTVDAALKAYYEIDLDEYRDLNTGVPDWEAFFSDRDAALAQVPEEFDTLVEQYVSRHKSPLRQDFSDKFDEVIKPSGYLRMREITAERLGLNIDNIESLIVNDLRKRDQRAAPIDVAKAVDKILNFLLVERFGEDNAPTLTRMKNLMRESNPALDLELYRQGFVTTVRSLEAQSLGRQLMNGNNAYFIPPLAGDVQRRIERTGQ